MRLAINITTLTGVRLDVNPDETIELNMGGISLLSLEQRQASYTNAFTLPKTPTNDAVFSFASQPTRNNRPTVDVLITKGTFQRRATLRVIDFDNGYNVTMSYDTDAVIKKLKEQSIAVFDDWLDDVAASSGNLSPETLVEDVYAFTENRGIDGFGNIKTGGYYIFPLTNNLNAKEDNEEKYSTLFTDLRVLLSYIGKKLNIKIEGEILSDAEFLNSVIQNDYYRFILTEGGGLLNLTFKENNISISDITCNDVLRIISQLFFCDIAISEDTITFTKITSKIDGEPVLLEGFSFKKQHYSGYAKNNIISQIQIDERNEEEGIDTFAADGIGIKDVLNIKNTIPAKDENGYYILKPSTTAGKISILKIDNTMSSTATIYCDTASYPASIQATSVDVYYPKMISLSGVFSDILDDIFSNPIILKAQRYLTPIQAQDLMTTRIITSVQLGGTYWVDAMAHNLNTGNTVMTLIKIR